VKSRLVVDRIADELIVVRVSLGAVAAHRDVATRTAKQHSATEEHDLSKSRQ
jgi:hypothetical protein